MTQSWSSAQIRPLAFRDRCNMSQSSAFSSWRDLDKSSRSVRFKVTTTMSSCWLTLLPSHMTCHGARNSSWVWHGHRATTASILGAVPSSIRLDPDLCQ
ncbi:unnamed protein product [Durusdinium trenchii]|uniref:Uncharacterized protein n=1 Tax=Durusdinium trenchii TaxID=1381693 RepID=A0ABP0PED3_9DINO